MLRPVIVIHTQCLGTNGKTGVEGINRREVVEKDVETTPKTGDNNTAIVEKKKKKKIEIWSFVTALPSFPEYLALSLLFRLHSNDCLMLPLQLAFCFALLWSIL
jgi:hypothetical protein